MSMMALGRWAGGECSLLRVFFVFLFSREVIFLLIEESVLNGVKQIPFDGICDVVCSVEI